MTGKDKNLVNKNIDVVTLLYHLHLLVLGDGGIPMEDIQTARASMGKDVLMDEKHRFLGKILRRYYRKARKNGWDRTARLKDQGMEAWAIFTAKEAVVFYLHHGQGFGISEMAEYLHVPVRRLLAIFDEGKKRFQDHGDGDVARLLLELPPGQKTLKIEASKEKEGSSLGLKRKRIGKGMGILLVLVVLWGLSQREFFDSGRTTEEELPRITFSLESCGIGYQGIRLPETLEIARNNPWTGDTPERLPVFLNQFHALGKDPDFQALDQYYEDAVKIARAEDLAKSLRWVLTDRQGNIFIAEGKGAIFIHLDLSAYVEFQEPEPLPDIQEEELELQFAYLEHYRNRYSVLLEFIDPEMEVTLSFDELGHPVYEYFVYEGEGSLIEQMMQYSMRSAKFEIEEGLYGIHLPTPHTFEVLETYPVLSKEEALLRFEAGAYVTPLNVKGPLPREDIRRLDLLYFYNHHTPTLQPVYVAYVAENAPDDKGNVTYSLFYVPALRSDYVEILDEDA